MADMLQTLQLALDEGKFDQVTSHSLVDYAFEFVVLNSDPWVQYDRHHIDQLALLTLISRLACICKHWSLTIRLRVQYQALRVAQYSMKMATTSTWTGLHDSSLLGVFDIAVDFFMKSWGLLEPLSQRLRNVPMYELEEAELGDLLNVLISDGHAESLIHKGDGQELNPYVWVTPSLHMKLKW